MWCRWLLVHSLLIEVEGFPWNASSSLFARWFCFQRLLLLSVRQLPDHLINAIRWKRNVGRAQSKPTHTKGIRSRLGTGQRPRSKVVFISCKGVFSFLFPSNLF